MITDPATLTPVEYAPAAGVWLKRDDEFAVAGSCGGKVRTCLHIGLHARLDGKRVLVTAGSRHSPQVNIVASVALELGLRARCHVPAGPTTPEIEAAVAAGAHIERHRPGYNSVIVRRARLDVASDPLAAEVPFGMETPLAVAYTAAQVANLPFDRAFARIVVPVGSGMSLAGILAGLDNVGQHDVPVLGVVVGADPSRRLDRYHPMWRWRACTLVPAGVPYDREVPGILAGVELDPVYEAKCLPFLEPGDLFWVVGRRATV